MKILLTKCKVETLFNSSSLFLVKLDGELRIYMEKNWYFPNAKWASIFFLLSKSAFSTYFILMKFKSIVETLKFFEKVSVSVSVEIQNHGFGRSLVPW